MNTAFGKSKFRRRTTLFSALAAAGLIIASPSWAASFTYTTTAEWGTGVLTSTTTAPPPAGNGHVKLPAAILTPFDHIWVALSGRGTVARIDTDVDPTTIGNGDTVLTTAEAGGVAVKGEYYTAPAGLQRNPSRTTVDANGDVWVGNRDESSAVAGVASGSVAQISATPTGTTSNGVFGSAANGGAAGTFNALAWTNAGSADTAGGTSTATDSAQSMYVRTAGVNNVRALAVDSNNDLWVGGNNNFSGAPRPHQLYDTATGTPIPGAGNSFNTSVATDNANNGVGGGYGMVIDGNGVVWAATLDPGVLVRHDPVLDQTDRINMGRQTYGLGIDNNGKIWVSNWTDNTVQRVSSTGVIEGTFATGASGMRGVAVTADNDIWIAASNSNNVVRMNNDGTVQSIIATGNHPTGVAVDSNGKVWVTNFNSNTVSRIDPTLAGGNGGVDLTIELGAGANPYNYSDMTGTVLVGSTNPSGGWRKVMDGGVGALWDNLFYNTEAEGDVPATTALLIEARVSDDMAIWSPYMTYNTGDLLGLAGRYLEVRATLTRPAASTLTPVLSDLRVDYHVNDVPVPEPGTLALLAAALASLTGLRRRR